MVRAVIPPMEDSSSPYYLHPSDNPAQQLVSQPLIGSNYINWSRSIMTALIAKNKLQFINGVLLKPTDGDLLFPAWIRCNSMVVSWLRNSISSQICSSIMYLDDAREIWSDLRDRFSLCDSARAYQLRQKILSLSQGQDDVNTYFTNLRIVWDEYKHSLPITWCVCTTCRCQSASKWHNHQEHECVMQFLIGLKPAYSQIRSTILSMTPLPPLSKVFSLVLQEERQRMIEGNGNFSFSTPPSPSEQLYSANAATSNSYSRNRVCSYCGKNNHTVDKCFSIFGFPPGFGRGKHKSTQKDFSSFSSSKAVNFVDDSFSDPSDKVDTNSSPAMPTFDQCQQLITLLQTQLATAATQSTHSSPSLTASAAQNNFPSTQSTPFTGTTLFSPFVGTVASSSPVWLLDTGATHHVSCDLSLFATYSVVLDASVNLPNGVVASVTHVGTIHLTPSITLYSVLCVPTFSFNLVSVSSLTTSLSCNVIFTHSSLEIQGASLGIVIGRVDVWAICTPLM